MPTRNCPADRTSLFAVTGSTELGGGQDDHLPIGVWSGYTFRSAIRFDLDWTAVKRLTKAVIQLKTTTQNHVGFSASPDVLVRRATSSWSANGASGSSDGGGGWSTSPTVYPGPSVTSTGQATKKVPATQSTDFEVDVTAIARAWAPASVEDGGGAANYGVRLDAAGSGDVSEFGSMHASASYHPVLVLTYAVDSPPVATVIGPTGTVTTVRPTILGAATDADGDAITRYDIEVKKAGANVYAVTDPSGGPTLAHVPTADLPSGALTVRIRAMAGGVLGAWTAEAPFTVDRPPTFTAWTAPAATVSGTRRPVHTFTCADADGDPLEVYDIEVYSSAGGAPVGGVVASAYGTTAGIAGMGASWTPGVDLPPGECAARARVRTRGVWSDWSAYRVYAVVTANPSVAWTSPAADGGFMEIYRPDLENPAVTIARARPAIQFAYAPPASATITEVRVKAAVEDPGNSGIAVGVVIVDSVVASVPAGGVFGPYGPMFPGDIAAGWLYGSLRITVTVKSSNAGQTVAVRIGRWSAGEWYGSLALGDSVSDLAAVETPKGDSCAVLYRAQSSPTAAAGAAPWRLRAALGTLAAELPATNAYLGVRVRIGRLADDPNLVVNPSFENGLTGWQYTPGGAVEVGASGSAIDGSNVLIIGQVAAAFPSAQQVVAVVPGATYRLSAYAARFGGANNAYVRADAIRPDGSTLASGVIQLVYTTGPGTVYKEGWYTVPADGTVDRLQVLAFIAANPSAAADVWVVDMVTLRGMGPGDAGMDRLELDWRSLG